MPTRFVTAIHNRVQEESFARDILIVCDRCGRDAVVIGLEGLPPDIKFVPKASCARCGRVWEVQPKTKSKSADRPPFRFEWLPLWLSTDFRGNRLWAYNDRHLRWLESFIGADIREDKLDGGSSALHAILPRWMTSTKNRTGIMTALRRLREKLPTR
jgi:ribosomal protein L37E